MVTKVAILTLMLSIYLGVHLHCLLVIKYVQIKYLGIMLIYIMIEIDEASFSKVHFKQNVYINLKKLTVEQIK